MKEKERLKIIDLLKGVAIFLVVFGHSIQYGSGNYFYKEELFFSNNLFKLIYSFHMPLFMLISGFLFYKTKNSILKVVVKSKIKALLLPLITWQSIFYIVSFLFISTLEFSLKKYTSSLIYGLWFLWAVFYCSIIVLIIDKIIYEEKIKKFLFLLIVIITFFTPDNLNLNLYKFVYPYFLIGYYSNEFIRILEKKFKISNFVLITVIFFILLQLYNYDSYIYTSKYSIIFNENDVKTQLYINLYRFIIGLFGSIWMIFIIKYLDNNLNEESTLRKILELLGKNSMGIYIISGYIFLIFPKIKLFQYLNYYQTLFQTLLILFFSLFFMSIIKRNKILNQILLGNKK